MTIVHEADPQARFQAMLTGSLGETRDFAWLASPHGLVAVCARSLRMSDDAPLQDPGMDGLLEALDDFLPHLPNRRGSERARGLVALATGDHAAAVQAFGSDDAVGVIRSLLAGTAPEPIAMSTASALTSRHADGQVVDLVLSLLPGPDVVVLDVRTAPFLRCDDAFAAALAAAVNSADLRGRGTVLWSLFSQRTRAPLDVIVGPSIGLAAAAAAAARRLAGKALPQLDPTWAFTGGLTPDGRATSLLDPSGDTTSYLEKLRAAGDRTVVVPAADAAAVTELGHQNGLVAKVVGAASIGEVDDLVARHLAGKIGWERAMSGRPVDPNARRKIALALLAAVVPIAAGLIAARALWQQHQRSAALAEVRRAMAPVGVTPVGGEPFSIAKFEVTGSQMRDCLRASDGCRLEGEQVAEGADDLPVVSISWRLAEQFCDWVGGSLPTFGQWGAAVRAWATDEWPLSLGNGAKLPDGKPDKVGIGSALTPHDAKVSNLVLNALEWTRTQCESPFVPCTDIPPDGVPVAGVGVRVVGLLADQVSNRANNPVGSTAWLDRAYHLGSMQRASDPKPQTGFRCVFQAKGA